MELQTFLNDTTKVIGDTQAALLNATTPAEYAQAAYDGLANMVAMCNTANEGGTQIEEIPGVPE